MTDRIGGYSLGATLLVAIGAALVSSPAAAVTLDGFKDQGLVTIYGSYAPGGNCTRQPLLVIDDRGFTFTTAGRTVTQSRVEFAASYLGPQYEGISMVFFPFPEGEFEPGPVLMTVNDGERRGAIRLESNLAPGQRLSAMHSALTSAPLQLCPGTAPPEAAAALAAEEAAIAEAKAEASKPGIPAEWNNLASMVGRYPRSLGAESVDVFTSGGVAAAVKALMGGKTEVLETNLSVSSPIERQGQIYFVSGNAPHKGGEEQAYLLIDPARRAVQVGLWERGKLTVYAPGGTRIPLPRDVATMVNNSPSETAVPLPGTPWELVPAQGREPIAYVDAAGSTHYQSFSVFCDRGQVMMAALTTKPLPGQTHTVTWNFAGRIVDVVVQRSNNEGTFWQASLANSPLVGMLAQSSGEVLLRLDGQLEGQALLANSTATLRTALRTCLRI